MKKILTSLFVIGVTVAATVGATRAYFTDNATSTDNVLGTGTFNVKLAGENSSGTKYSNMENRKFFNVSGLMPGGDPEVAYIEVKNDSSVPMVFRLYAKNIESDLYSLRDVINVKVTLIPHGDDYDPVLTGGRYGPSTGAEIYDSTLSGIIGKDNALDNVFSACRTGGDGELPPGFNVVYRVEVSLDWSAENAYQDTELTADLQLDATQFDKEEACYWTGDSWEYTAW